MGAIQRRLLLSWRLMTSLARHVTRGSTRNGSSHVPESLSYVHGTGTLPLTGATIGQLLENTTGKSPDMEAVVVCQQNTRLTFQQLLQQVSRQQIRNRVCKAETAKLIARPNCYCCVQPFLGLACFCSVVMHQ